MKKGETYEEKFLIIDNSTKWFYSGETECLPWIIYAFNADWHFAIEFESREKAEECITRFLKEKTDSDGNSELPSNRFSVVLMMFKCV